MSNIPQPNPATETQPTPPTPHQQPHSATEKEPVARKVGVGLAVAVLGGVAKKVVEKVVDALTGAKHYD